MAQVDTGLGWSAKQDWLYPVSGLLCETGSDKITDNPLPQANTLSAIETVGYIGWYNQDGNPIYVADQIGAPPRTAFIYSDNGTYRLALVCASQQPSSSVFRVANSDIRPSNVGAASVWANNYHASSGLYYGTTSMNFGYYWPTSISMFGSAGRLPVYNSLNDGLNDMVTKTPINKTNMGYAVACVAKWRTSANVVIQSPILISTDSGITDMSTSGTYQIAKYRTRRDGMTFYMSFYQDLPGVLTSLVPVYDISSPEEPYANLDELFNLICAPDQANVLVTETADPYEDFPPTEEDAGDPDPDPEDDDIEEEDLPTMSFATAGFCRIYRPSFSQVSALASYMWTDQNFLQTVINHLKQILENPIDAIISLSIVPCIPNVLTDEEVKVMYVPTGVYMPPVQRQFVSVDCGSYKLTEMYGSALDYNPYTSVQLYLPYIGVVQLDTDEVMGKTISIGYRIDVVTGVCCAYVKANNDILYQFSGHCSIHQPITSADFSGYINAALAAGKLVASIAAAGAGAPAVAATLAGAPSPSISGTESKTVETERNPNTGRQITVGTRKRESQTYNPGASFGEVATRGVSNTVGAVMNSKTIIQHSGGFSGNSGFMAAVRRPYLIVTRPRIANPENYGKYNGRPSMIYLNLGECTGFTQVQSIQLTGIDATNPELSEIVTLLNAGVIL